MFWWRVSTADLVDLNVPEGLDNGSSIGAEFELLLLLELFNNGSAIGELTLLPPPLNGSINPLSGSDSGPIDVTVVLTTLMFDLPTDFGVTTVTCATSLGRFGWSGWLTADDSFRAILVFSLS